MGMYYETKLVFGYMINRDEDYPKVDWDNDESIEKYENWKDDYGINEYRHLFDYYDWDEPYEFFGIILDGCECGEVKPFKDFEDKADDFSLKQRPDWENCEKEFHRLFPDSTQKPDYYIMSVVW